MDPSALSLLVVGTSTAVSGVLLLLRRAAVVSALLLVAAGGTAVGAAMLLAAGRDQAALTVAILSIGVLLLLSLATYPVLRWRHPVDFVALVTLLGCGLTGLLWQEALEAVGLVQFTVLLAYIWWRVETATGRERRAVQWLAVALGSTSLTFALLVFATEAWAGGSWLGVVFALLGPAMYVGATLPDLVDVRRLVVVSVVFAVAVVTYMALFVLAIAMLEATGADDLSVGALALVGAIVAVTFAPLQVVLRGVVDQLLFGVRLDPLEAVSAVAGTIGGDEPLPALRAVREGLALPYAAVVVGGEVVAASGTESTHTRSFDLDGSGELVVGLRAGNLELSGADEHVLRLVVPLLAQTMRARAVAQELLASRGVRIAAIEEERRRLRRELHDGLGPRLSGVAFTSDAARNLVRSDPAAAERMLTQLRADTVAAIEEIRRLVYAMRPPALDELGLVPALRQQAVGLHNRAGEPVAVRVTAPEDLPDLPAAVEVAAYRIVTEALTNVARHSSSSSADVRIDATDDGLALEVTDTGTSGLWRPGVGLSSMRERAAELGGSLEAGPGPRGGRVAVLLPL
jgi:two-component system, NarL family, sensor kinase